MTPLEATKIGYTSLHPGLSHSGYAIFIHENALNFLNKAVQDNYPSFKLIRKLVSMRSNPRPWDAGIKKGKTDHRQLTIEGLWVNYFISNGCVYIDSIRLNTIAEAGANPLKNEYLNNPTQDTPSLTGMMARLAVSPFSLIPGFLPLAFTSPAFNNHAPVYQDMGKSDTKVASNTAKSIKQIINRLI